MFILEILNNYNNIVSPRFDINQKIDNNMDSLFKTNINEIDNKLKFNFSKPISLNKDEMDDLESQRSLMDSKANKKEEVINEFN